MADWFSFNGKSSTELGVHVMSFPQVPIPEVRADFKQILGRSGSLTILEGEDVYNDVLLSITCFVSDLSKLNQISSWLRGVNGDSGLIRGDRPYEYYVGRLVNQTDLSKIIRDDQHRVFPAVFRCKPYRYVYTTFEVSLYSGRPHQIRIHLASIGHPLVGDPLYGLTGQPLENVPGLPGDGGYFLHAQFLKFHHPITGEQINLEAALPSGFSLHQ